MNTTRHESPKAKRRSRRFRRVVLGGGVLRECNFALSELNIFSGFARRVALRLPYADQFRAFGARGCFRPEEMAFPCVTVLGAWSDLCPEGTKLVSAGRAKRSPVYSEKEFSTLKECNWKEGV